MALALVDLARPALLNNNIGGIQQDILISPVSNFLSLVEPPTSHSALGDSAKIAGPHTFTSPAGFIKLVGDYKTNSFEGDMNAEFGSNNMEYKITAHYHGLTASSEEIANLLTNADLIILVRNIKPGAAEEVFQFGLGTMPAFLSSKKVTSGTPSDGKKGYEFVFIARQPMIYTYTGAITMKT